jgi:hypothetical protein
LKIFSQHIGVLRGLSLILDLIVIGTNSFAQAGEDSYNLGSLQNKISVEITGAILPKARINNIEGNYTLNSKLQSSFSLGLDYDFGALHSWIFESGIHINLTKRNFFLLIPDSDLDGYPPSEGAPQIEDKEVYFKITMPFIVKKIFQFNRKGFWDINGGIKLNYSGFSTDEGIGSSIADTSFQSTNIFYGEFTSNNGKKPWLTFTVGLSRSLWLDNENILTVGLFSEFSGTDYLYGEYEITIPNKPISKGTLAVSGSCLGMTVRYTFTGLNRKFVKSHTSN